MKRALSSWYEVTERFDAVGTYYVQAESPSEAKRKVADGEDYLEGRAAWSGAEVVRNTGRIVGRAEPVHERDLPTWAQEDLGMIEASS